MAALLPSRAATSAASATTTSRSIRGGVQQVANILRFEKDFPGAAIIRLEQNYRSTSHILAAADGLIAHNAGRLGKTLWTDAGDGEKVRVIGVWDGPEEARRVGEEAESRMRSGGSLDDVAILVRAQFQTREFEERFIAIGLPYQIIGGFRSTSEPRSAMQLPICGW
jgi:Superfamily I DNA and RNA helicases